MEPFIGKPPKSKIPVPQSMYKNNTDVLDDYDDQDFLLENIPCPWDKNPRGGPKDSPNFKGANTKKRKKQSEPPPRPPSGLSENDSNSFLVPVHLDLDDDTDFEDDLPLYTKYLENVTPSRDSSRIPVQKSRSIGNIRDTAAGYYFSETADPDVIKVRVPGRGQKLDMSDDTRGRSYSDTRKLTDSNIRKRSDSTTRGRADSTTRGRTKVKNDGKKGRTASSGTVKDILGSTTGLAKKKSKKGDTSPSKSSTSSKDTKTDAPVDPSSESSILPNPENEVTDPQQSAEAKKEDAENSDKQKENVKTQKAKGKGMGATSKPLKDAKKTQKGTASSAGATTEPPKGGRSKTPAAVRQKEKSRPGATKEIQKKKGNGKTASQNGAGGKDTKKKDTTADAEGATTVASEEAADPTKDPPKPPEPINKNEYEEYLSKILTKKVVEKKEGEEEVPLTFLEMCQRFDWKGVEESLKTYEKEISADEPEKPKPLAGIIEPDTMWTPLMYAVIDNQIPIAEKMIDLGCDVNLRNKESLTPLHVGSLYARDEMISFLLLKEADITLLTEPKKQSALHLACARPSGNGASILKVLLTVASREARLQKDDDGNIPLFVALNSGSRGACQELLTNFAYEQVRVHSGPYKDTALHMAVRKRDLEIARIVVDSSANVDSRNGEHQTALHIASALGDESLAKFFYLCRANPNIADKEDRTPIHLAAMHGCTKIIDLLADKFKVSVFERTKDGSTLMHIASLHGHPETAMALFRKGVPLQMPNKGGARSIHISARFGQEQMIGKLLEKGEKVDAVTNDNYTALHIGVEAGHPKVVETLLGYGAVVHIKGGKAQETPLHIAARVDDGDKCAQMLLKSGADPNITMENGETPLHVAARHGRHQIIKLILQSGADVLHKSKEGETPLHLACQYGHVRIVRELLASISNEEVSLYINTVTGKGETALHYAAKLYNIVAVLTPQVSISSMYSQQSFNSSAIPQKDSPTKGNLTGTGKDAVAKKLHVDAGREIAKMLLDGGASVNLQTRETHETPFHYCAREGNNDILVEMLSRMSQVESQRALNRQSTKGWSPLLTGCHKGHVDVVKTLLENNARVDVFDLEGRSGLHLAAEAGFIDICGILLKHRAFINAKSRVGLTALHLAAMKGYTKLCLFLIQEHGAFVDVGTLKKQTPLHMAASAGQMEVCRLLMGLRANSDATDDEGQKPIHLAAENNHADVIKLFLKQQNSLVSSSTKDGSTCAHLAAQQGSIKVLEELMKFDRAGVISARNRSTDATALQLAAEGGHAELVKSLLDAGASATDENRAGYAAVHLAAKNGHTNVIDALRSSNAIKLTSRKIGLTALHIAAFYGQQETVRDLLQHMPATTASEPPVSQKASFIKELGKEAGLTPLHMGAYSGEENVVRLLLNVQGVQVDAPTANLGYNPLHLACRGGHTPVVGLLLSRSTELLESKDATGKTSLHIASIHGHKQMCEVLLGQGGEIDAVDSELWTPLHCASKAGHLDVVGLLVESGASTLAKTAKGYSPIWFAASESHNLVLSYLMKKEHDTYGLLEDASFVYHLTICGKNCDNEPLNEFVLSSPAPLDVAAKLSNFLVVVSYKEKERAKDLLAASNHCEVMATELLALAASAESPAKILVAVDRKGTEFLDVLIENEQKEVIAHTVVQRYLQELWVGNLEWANWKKLLLFFTFILVPPVWVTFSLPLGHIYYKIPIIKFMSYLTSHIHLMILLCFICVTPIYPVLPIRQDLSPYWYEWMFMAWILGLVVAEISNPSDKGGLGWIKVTVIAFSITAVFIHCIGFVVAKSTYGLLLYIRNQSFGLAILFAAVQILDFLSFHYLFGPWAIIIGNLMKDLARFLAVLAIFMLGFSFFMCSLNLPTFERPKDAVYKQTLTNGLPSGVLVTPIDAIELLFFALFGQTTATDMKIEPGHPGWTLILFKLYIGVYLLVSVIVLINLLIAMMSDTYQRIQAQSDIEWKYGLAKLIRNMHRTAATPSPINLFTAWFLWIVKQCKRGTATESPLEYGRKDPVLTDEKPKKKGLFSFAFGKPTANQRWRNIFKKTQMTPRGSAAMRRSVVQAQHQQQAQPTNAPGSPYHGLGSTVSMGASSRIETVTDWNIIAKKYRALVGLDESVGGSAEAEVPIEGSAVNVQNP